LQVTFFCLIVLPPLVDLDHFGVFMGDIIYKLCACEHWPSLVHQALSNCFRQNGMLARWETLRRANEAKLAKEEE
jgi:hypothetical protein